METDKIKDLLLKRLPKERFYHTMGVCNTAACLAMKYGEDVNKAYLAGLLHDCAKAFKSDKYLEMAKEYGIIPTASEKENPGLLHAKLGMVLAKTEYGVEDEDILNAISYHTTGRPDMSMLEKIIYVADYIEPGRKLNKIDEIRKLAFDNINKALSVILENTIKHVKETGRVLDSKSVETYEYYKGL